MFDDGDPLLERVRALALALPGASEKMSHGRPAFFTTKVFTYFSGSQKISDSWVQHPHSIMVKLDPDESRALLTEERCWVPAYLGVSGWVGVDIAENSDWGEIAELMEASFRETAPATLVKHLPHQ